MEILSYIEYINEEYKNITLFHGTIYKRFDKFKQVPIFLTESPEFAWHYANQKTMDMGMDADISIAQVNVEGNIFDINNDEDKNKLIKRLPNKVKVYDSTGFFDYDLTKEEILNRMEGFFYEEPVDYIINSKIGDLVPNPMYRREELEIIKKDSNYVYTIKESEIDDIIRLLGSGEFTKEGLVNNNVRNDIQSILKEHNNYIKELYKKVYNKEPYGRDINRYLSLLMLDKSLLTEDEYDKIYDTYNSAKEKILKYLIKNIDKHYYIKRWNKKPEKMTLKDTWRFYENETVIDILNSLKYDGYVATEDGSKTYAIFNSKCIKNVKWL